jgi:hypothetical protein
MLIACFTASGVDGGSGVGGRVQQRRHCPAARALAFSQKRSNLMQPRRFPQWSDLGNGQKTVLRLGVLVQIGLLIAALVDIRLRPAAQIHGNKLLWTAAAFVNFIGPIAYFVFGRKRN